MVIIRSRCYFPYYDFKLQKWKTRVENNFRAQIRNVALSDDGRKLFLYVDKIIALSSSTVVKIPESTQPKKCKI